MTEPAHIGILRQRSGVGVLTAFVAATAARKPASVTSDSRERLELLLRASVR